MLSSYRAAGCDTICYDFLYVRHIGYRLGMFFGVMGDGQQPALGKNNDEVTNVRMVRILTSVAQSHSFAERLPLFLHRMTQRWPGESWYAATDAGSSNMHMWLRAAHGGATAVVSLDGYCCDVTFESPLCCSVQTCEQQRLVF